VIALFPLFVEGSPPLPLNAKQSTCQKSEVFLDSLIELANAKKTFGEGEKAICGDWKRMGRFSFESEPEKEAD
jgi:hypothetical protein